MKIIINTIPLLSPLTGVGNYIYQIAKSLQAIDTVNNYSYFYGYYSKKLFYSEGGIFYQIKELLKNTPVLGSKARNLRNTASVLTMKSFDVYFEPNFIPINIKAKHTVIAIPDFSFKVHPEWHPKGRINYFENNFWNNIKKADIMIFISNYIKECAINLYNFPESKLRTIHLGFDKDIFKIYGHQESEFIRNKYGLPENFILFVGSIEPRKNLKNLIHAYISLNKTIRNEFKLVLVGFKGWENREIMELLRKEDTDIVYTRYVPDSDLGKLYNCATLFVYPSLYEGFGLPPLEAMACGCPVVVSNAASLPEVCGDAAYYVAPDNIESIAEGIYKALTDNELRQGLIKKGFERAKLFTWEKSAKEHLKVFEDILNS